jgi:hypothetical protein
MRRALAAVLTIMGLMLCLPPAQAANIIVETPAGGATAKSPAIPPSGTTRIPSVREFGPQRPAFMNDTPPPGEKPAAAAPVQKPVVLFKLRLTGMIETGDADKLRGILDKLLASIGKTDGPMAVVELSSMGGSLTEGFLIGSLLREFKVIAVVRQRDFCMSSCALAFLAGNMHRVPPEKYPAECNVEIGGKVAFHNFFLNRNGLREVTVEDPVQSRLQGFADARGGAALLIKYAGEIGLQPNFVASMMGRPVDDFQYIETVEQFLSLHVCLIGLERPSAPMEAQAVNICSNSIGPKEGGGALRARLMQPDVVKLSLLERIQAYMQNSKAKGRLAAQLASSAVMRVREEIDRLYDDLRAAGVALPDIVGPTYEVTQDVSGTLQLACYVSMSASDPDDYDVAIPGPKGLGEAPRSPPENSRRLFLFDQKDVINPRPH